MRGGADDGSSDDSRGDDGRSDDGDDPEAIQAAARALPVALMALADRRAAPRCA